MVDMGGMGCGSVVFVRVCGVGALVKAQGVGGGVGDARTDMECGSKGVVGRGRMHGSVESDVVVGG